MANALLPGQSEIDTVVLRLPDRGVEIKNWSRYSLTSRFLVPTSAWSFAVSDEDLSLTDALVPGARAQLFINDHIQCTGTIDRKSVDTSDAGTTVTIQGRDILGPVVDSTVDPAFRFISGMTIVDVVGAVLAPFGITKITNSSDADVNAVTGYARGKGASTTSAPVVAHVAPSTAVTQIAGKPVTVLSAANRPDLRTLTVEQAKPHVGEGAYAYLERLLKRMGLAMWAMSDGTGVIIDKADFSTNYTQQVITHRRSDPSQNNVKRGSMVVDLVSQPSCIVAFGFGGSKDVAKIKTIIIMINELTGLDAFDNPLSEVRAIIARYPSAKLLPIRPEVSLRLRKQGDPTIAKPFFVKDDEAKSFAQLEAYTRRTMAEHQQKALQLTYEVIGHTFDGHPWAWGLNVAVNDEALKIHQSMWVVEKTFSKSIGAGTTSELKLILPYTAAIGS